MKPRFFFSVTRVVVATLFYFFLVVGIYLLASEIINLVSGQKIPTGSNLYDSEVISFGALHHPDQAPVFSQDGRARYVPVGNHYGVSAAPESPLGYLNFGFRLASVALILLVFWNLKRIFREVSIAELFRNSVVKRLKIVALVFLFNDLLKGIHYVVFNHLMDTTFPETNLRLVTDFGRGFFVALIIWVIALVYERGVSYQEENALTI